jgi:hypothetical protein
VAHNGPSLTNAARIAKLQLTYNVPEERAGVTVRLVVAGIGPNGRSAVIRDEELAVERGATSVTKDLWRTSGCPPTVAEPSGEDGRFVGCSPGETLWTQWFPAEGEAAFHRTDTISYNVVLSGQLELLLEEGDVTLHEGDCLVVLGVRHGWRIPAGETRVSCSMIGTVRDR